MGYGRKIAHSGAALALQLSGAANAAEQPEPLNVTRLGDSESELLVSAAAGQTRNPDYNEGEFRRAIAATLRAEQQSIQASCRSVPTVSSPIEARWAWEARCRYKRY